MYRILPIPLSLQLEVLLHKTITCKVNHSPAQLQLLWFSKVIILLHLIIILRTRNNLLEQTNYMDSVTFTIAPKVKIQVVEKNNSSSYRVQEISW